MKLFDKDHTVDRSTWKPGPWDNEPDYYEWTTAAGYPAYIGRLNSGAWAGSVSAPAPIGDLYLQQKFYNKLSVNNFDKFTVGHTSYNEVPGILDYCTSGEHWEAPGTSSRSFWRGPYKTLEEFKERCENLAEAIMALHNDPNLYKDW